MENTEVNVKDASNTYKYLSYVMACLSLFVALCGIAFSIYALIEIEKNGWGWAPIVVAVIVTIIAILAFFKIHYGMKLQAKPVTNIDPQVTPPPPNINPQPPSEPQIIARVQSLP